MAPRHAFQQQARISKHPSLHRRIQEKLFQHILLRVAAAHPVHHTNGRAHHGNGAGIITATMRQNGFAHG
jgi:hypothetical protein